MLNIKQIELKWRKAQFMLFTETQIHCHYFCIQTCAWVTNKDFTLDIENVISSDILMTGPQM